MKYTICKLTPDNAPDGYKPEQEFAPTFDAAVLQFTAMLGRAQDGETIQLSRVTRSLLREVTKGREVGSGKAI